MLDLPYFAAQTSCIAEDRSTPTPRRGEMHRHAGVYQTNHFRAETLISNVWISWNFRLPKADQG